VGFADNLSGEDGLPASGKGTSRWSVRGLVARCWRARFIRFLLVGGLNTLFGYSVFALLILLHVVYPVAAFLATTLGVLFNFKSYGVLVFGSHDNRLIFRFFFVYGICYLVGLVPLAWASAHGVSLLLMAAICAIPMAGFAFTLNRRLVFRRMS
jgi:putative flippase GtrA